MNETDVISIRKENFPFFHASINHVKDIFIHSTNTIQKLYDGGATSVNLTLLKIQTSLCPRSEARKGKSKKRKKVKKFKKGVRYHFLQFCDN